MNFTDLISSAWTETLGYGIIHTMWIGCVIGLFAFLMLRNKRNSTPQLRYLISAISLVLIFGTFAVSIGISWPGEEARTEVTKPIATETELMNAKISSSEPDQEKGFFAIEKLESAFPLIVSLWFAGSIFLLLRTIIGLIWVMKIKNDQTYGMPLYWERKFAQWKKETGIYQKVKLVESSLASVPMTIGHFRPFVVLPAGATATLSVDELKMIVLHELAHIKRYDYLFNIFQSIIEAILFYHPVVWWLSSEVKKEREHISDDLAVKWGGSPQKLAEALAKISDTNYNSPQLALTLVSKKAHLLNRVRRLLTKQEISSQSPEKLTIMIIVILLTALLSTSAMNYAEQVHQANEASSVLSTLNPPQLYSVKSGNTHSFEVKADPPEGKVKVVRKFEEGPYDKAKVVVEEGEIQKLKVNGKRIDEEDYHHYQGLVNELVPGFSDEHTVVLSRGLKFKPHDISKHGIAPSPAFHKYGFEFHNTPRPPSPPKLNAIPRPPVPPMPLLRSGKIDKKLFNMGLGDPDSAKIDTIIIKYDSAGVIKEHSFTIPKMHFEFDFDEEAWNANIEAWEKSREDFEFDGSQYQIMMENYARSMENFSQQIEEFSRQMEAFGESFEVEMEKRMEIHEERTKEIEERIEKEHRSQLELNKQRIKSVGEKLLEMGLIEDSDAFSIELKKGTLKVNGEEKDEATYQEFKDWYEDEFDTEITEKMNIVLNVN